MAKQLESYNKGVLFLNTVSAVAVNRGVKLRLNPRFKDGWMPVCVCEGECERVILCSLGTSKGRKCIMP